MGCGQPAGPIDSGVRQLQLLVGSGSLGAAAVDDSPVGPDEFSVERGHVSLEVLRMAWPSSRATARTGSPHVTASVGKRRQNLWVRVWVRMVAPHARLHRSFPQSSAFAQVASGATACIRFWSQPVIVRLPSAPPSLTSANESTTVIKPDAWVRVCRMIGIGQPDLRARSGAAGSRQSCRERRGWLLARATDTTGSAAGSNFSRDLPSAPAGLAGRRRVRPAPSRDAGGTQRGKSGRLASGVDACPHSVDRDVPTGPAPIDRGKTARSAA